MTCISFAGAWCEPKYVKNILNDIDNHFRRATPILEQRQLGVEGDKLVYVNEMETNNPMEIG